MSRHVGRKDHTSYDVLYVARFVGGVTLQEIYPTILFQNVPELIQVHFFQNGYIFGLVG